MGRARPVAVQKAFIPHASFFENLATFALRCGRRVPIIGFALPILFLQKYL